MKLYDNSHLFPLPLAEEPLPTSMEQNRKSKRTLNPLCFRGGAYLNLLSQQIIQLIAEENYRKPERECPQSVPSCARASQVRGSSWTLDFACSARVKVIMSIGEVLIIATAPCSQGISACASSRASQLLWGEEARRYAPLDFMRVADNATMMGCQVVIPSVRCSC